MIKLSNIFTAVLVITMAAGGSCRHEREYSREVQERISSVENNLIGLTAEKRFRRWSLQQRMAFYNIKGLSIAVINNYRIEWAKGYGWADIDENRLVRENTLFQAASISKSLNGMGILKLVQDGKLTLDADINEYLRSWKFPYDEISGSRRITLAALLSHTAGVGIHGFPGYEPTDTIPTLIQILDGLSPANTSPVRSLSGPGEKVEYSGGGITITEQVVEDATGIKYDDYMRKHVLKPLGMSNSFFTQPPPGKYRNRLATGYYITGEEVKGKYHIYPEKAAAGLWTTPIDLSLFLIEIQLSYLGRSQKVLKPVMTRLMVTPVMQDAALGVFVSRRDSIIYFSHNGGNAGFSCQATACLTDGKGVVIMTNSDNGSILDEIVNSVALTYRWKNYLPFPERRVRPPVTRP